MYCSCMYVVHELHHKRYTVGAAYSQLGSEYHFLTCIWYELHLHLHNTSLRNSSCYSMLLRTLPHPSLV